MSVLFPAKYLVTGASGLLGQVLVPHLVLQGHIVYAVTHVRPVLKKSDSIKEVYCDLTDEQQLSSLLNRVNPDVVIHAAGLTSVDQCEKNPDEAFLLNTEIPARLADWCARYQKKYVFISSDHVTGGHIPLFDEETTISPINVYARTKAKAEQEVSLRCPDAQIIRTNFFGRGPEWRKSLTDWLWDKAQASDNIPAFTDSYFSPLSVHYLAQTISSLSVRPESGIFHVGGSERLSKYDFALRFINFFGFDPTLVRPILTKDANLSAPRPTDMSMSVKKIEGILNSPMPDIEESFESIRNDYR